MSVRSLSNPCPHCGDRGPFFLVKNWDLELCFAKGYWCEVCASSWDARACDKQDYPEEYALHTNDKKADSDS